MGVLMHRTIAFRPTARGGGRHPREFPRVRAQLGHEVLYFLRCGWEAPLPKRSGSSASRSPT
jgi:hypothetical protein